MLKLELQAKRKQLLEETMRVSATSHSSSNEIRLFSRNVKVILKEESPIYSLRSLVPSGKVVINAGATVRVNFTVIKVGQAGQFDFKVSRLLQQVSYIEPLPLTDYRSRICNHFVFHQSVLPVLSSYFHST